MGGGGETISKKKMSKYAKKLFRNRISSKTGVSRLLSLKKLLKISEKLPPELKNATDLSR